MSLSCVRHPMTLGEHICGECGHQFCPECVVFPFGAARPPLCIACALELGGVRRRATDRPKLTRKAVRQRLAARRGTTEQPEEAPTGERTSDPARSFPAEDLPLDSAPGGWQRRFD